MFREEEAAVGALSIEHALIDPVAAVDVIRRGRAERRSPIEIILTDALIPEQVLLAAVAKELDLELCDLFAPNRPYKPSRKLLERCDLTWLEKLKAIPLIDPGGSVVVAAADPTDPSLDDYLSVTFTEGFRVVLAAPGQVSQMLLAESAAATSDEVAAEAAPDQPQAEPGTQRIATVAEGRTPVIEWLNSTLSTCAAQRASDLHLEITEDDRMLARMRVDSTLVPIPFPLVGQEVQVIAALLARSGMDSANLREPQDGSFTFAAGGRRLDARIGMVPLNTGPKVVVRFLDPANLRRLEELGFTGTSLQLMRRGINMPQGLIVTAGPTGSGKTTTQYALLSEVAGTSLNVMTLENPVEYALPFVSQIPVSNDRGARSVTFARGLRQILRLDPDVILVGEVRDAETCQATLDASITGHLTLTTVHANSAVEVVSRLIELGGSQYLVSQALTLSVSQRLVRRAHSCKTTAPITEGQRIALADVGVTAPEVVATAVGCTGCGQRGYLGRLAVAEILAPNRDTRALIATGAPMPEVLASVASTSGYVPAQHDATRLLHSLDTTVEEVIRALATSQL